jgi:hypothetical protein
MWMVSPLTFLMAVVKVSDHPPSTMDKSTFRFSLNHRAPSEVSQSSSWAIDSPVSVSERCAIVPLLSSCT